MPVVLQRCISKEDLEKGHCYVPAGTQFTCFTSTVMCLQVLSLLSLSHFEMRWRSGTVMCLQVLRLLAILVQKYKY